MKKMLFELTVILVVLFSVWFTLSLVDWMTLFRIERVTKNTEEKVGDVFWDWLNTSESKISSDSVITPIDTLLAHLCTKNGIDRTKIKFHLLRKDEVNAFALPNNHLVVFSGLIAACENEAEFCGVLCHEIAHMEKNHVMNKLVKEVGLSVLVSMSSGRGNSGIIKESIKFLSSTAYDRKLESEADKTAVEYLINADIDPEPFANFLFRLSHEKNLPEQFYWISTHPESKERSVKIIDYIGKSTVSKKQILGDTRWAALKSRISND